MMQLSERRLSQYFQYASAFAGLAHQHDRATLELDLDDRGQIRTRLFFTMPTGEREYIQSPSLHDLIVTR